MSFLRDNKIRVCLLFLILALAAFTRFSRLDWSLWVDESATWPQVKIVWEESLLQRDTQSPEAKSIFIGYFIEGLSYKLFGGDERGTRTLPALFGVLSIALLLFFVKRLHNYETACIAGCIAVFSSWHLFHCQSARVYSYAFFFSSLVFFMAAFAWQKNSFGWGALSGFFSALAILIHNFTILVPLSLFGFVVFEKWIWRKEIAKKAIWGYITVGIPLLIASLGYAVWMLSGLQAVKRWTWGNTSLYSFFWLVFLLEYPVALMAFLGGILSLSKKGTFLDRMCLVVCLTTISINFLAPMIFPYRPDYIFPGAIAFFILAARAVVEIYEAVKPHSQFWAISFCIFFILLPLPTFLSYYQDGNRPDFRGAAQFVAANAKPEDIVAAHSSRVIQHYLPNIKVQDVYLPPNFKTRFVQMLAEGKMQEWSDLSHWITEGKRVWFICDSGYEGPHPVLERWLWENGVRMLRIQKKRLDCRIETADVYLLQKKT